MWTPAERYQASKQLQRRGWVSLLGAAKILGISYPTIQKMKRKGEILTTFVGTHRITKGELQQAAKKRGITIDALIRQPSLSIPIIDEQEE